MKPESISRISRILSKMMIMFLFVFILCKLNSWNLIKLKIQFYTNTLKLILKN